MDIFLLCNPVHRIVLAVLFGIAYSKDCTGELMRPVKKASRMREEPRTNAKIVRDSEWAETIFKARMEGQSLDAIAKATGLTTAAICYHVRRQLIERQQRMALTVDSYVQLHMERLEMLWEIALNKARDGDPAHMRVALQVLKQQNDLLGLDAPKRAQVSFAPSPDMYDMGKLSIKQLQTLAKILKGAKVNDEEMKQLEESTLDATLGLKE